MNVFYNAYVLNKPITGVGRYLQSLSYIDSNYNKIALTPNAHICWENKFCKIRSSDIQSKFFKLIWNFFHPLFYNEKFDIYHSPYPSLPFFLPSNCKKIITVHDLIFIKSPGNYPFLELLFIKFSLKYALYKANVIICVSNYTRDSLIKLYPKAESKIIVVLNSSFKIRQEFQTTIQNVILKSLIYDKTKYFVLPSNRHPRKNIENTIAGFLETDFYKNNYKLVLTGIDESIRSYKLNKNIIDISYLSDHDYNLLLKNSKGIFYFSFDEGFGYPITEAIDHHIPVYCSCIPSTLEIFDNDSSYLCSDLSHRGIKIFLNSFFSNKQKTIELINLLQSKSTKFLFTNFQKKMSNIYTNNLC